MTQTPPSAKAVHPTRVYHTMHNHGRKETQLWRFLVPRPVKKVATSSNLPMLRNMLPTTFRDLSRTQETHPCTPPSRTSIPISPLYLPSLDFIDDEARSPGAATVLVEDRHVRQDDAPSLPLLDDTPTSPRAVTPNLAGEDEDFDDESPRSARINLHALFEEGAE